MEIPRPYLMFLGDVPDQLAAKTAHGIVDWRRDACIGQLRLPGCGADLGLPEMSIAAALAAGVQTLVIGVVNAGGRLPPHWIEPVVQALEAGLHVASGLHIRLASVPAIRGAPAERHGRQLFNMRRTSEVFATGKGDKRSGLRLLTVGTDCSSGKKYTVLALERAMRARGLDADFRATGQTGVFISGRGVAMSAVVADFISGAVEWLSPAAADGHWDLIEGQGSLFHPSFAGVSLGLLHGAQPDAFVVCHRTDAQDDARRAPRIADDRRGHRADAALRPPDQSRRPPVGIAINTQALAEADARDLLAALAREHGLPATDPVRFGVEAIIDRLLAEFPASARLGAAHG